MEDTILKAALAGLTSDLPRHVQDEVMAVETKTAVIKLAHELVAGRTITDGTPKRLLSIFCDIKLEKKCSPFCDIKLEEKDSPPKEQYLPLKPLALKQDTIFPGSAETSQENNDTAYKKLWGDFTTAAQELKNQHSDGITPTYLHNLQMLMQTYCWSIPSARYGKQSTVSLYDHSRMTGALAACLIKQKEADIQAMLDGHNKKVALLVGGDISGVQNFIYTITSRGATSALRGRSMYLQLLTDVLVRYVLRAIGMPLTNIIYAGGGNFYLLAPIEAKEKLADIQADISRKLLHHHQGDLFLALACEPLESNAFQGPAFSSRWDKLSAQLNCIKQRQFSELDQDAMMAHLFSPQGDGGNADKLCVVCQTEHPGTKVDDKNPTIRKCPACKNYEELGDNLRRAKYLTLLETAQADIDSGKRSQGWAEVLAHFGYEAQVYEDAEALLELPDKAGEVYALDDDNLDALPQRANLVRGRYFMVNVTPELSSDERNKLIDKVDDLPSAKSVKPFDVLALQSKGIHRLGVLRMDVDNLGKIFSVGLGEQATLSRTAALSFAMSLFFEGWVACIAQKIIDADGEQRLYSIYSGGDDLFFVGSWDLMPHLADCIRTDLHKYTGQHPDIHLSGGIALVTARYPLYQAAADAEAAEKAAKNRTCDEKNARDNTKKDTNDKPDHSEKNALNFLGQTIPWAQYNTVKKWQAELVDLVGAQNVPKSLIQRLNQLHAEYHDANQRLIWEANKNGRPAPKKKIYWGPWHWHAVYALSRLADKQKKGDVKDRIVKIRDELGNNFKNITWVGLAARWAELLLRGK